MLKRAWVVSGVWRRKTIMTVGGWQSRTTVEDMDLSLRTYVNGWKAVYLSDTTCLNEVTCQHLPCQRLHITPPARLSMPGNAPLGKPSAVLNNLRGGCKQG